MADLIDYFASTFFRDSDLESAQNDNAANQHAHIDAAFKSGEIDSRTARDLRERSVGGTDFFDSQAGKGGLPGLPGLALSYWWLIAAGVVVWVIYSGRLPAVLGAGKKLTSKLLKKT